MESDPTGAPRLALPRIRDMTPQSPSPLAVQEFNELLSTIDDLIEPFSAARRCFGHDGIRWPKGDEEDATTVVEAIESCLQSGEPGSFLRLGDGEGDLLALGLDRYPAMTRYCLRTRSFKHFGDLDLLEPDGDALLDALHRSLLGATAIGIPDPFALTATIHLGGIDTEVRPLHATETPTGQKISAIHGIASTYAYLAENANELDLASSTVVSARFHEHLLPHYRALIAGRHVVVVSCHRELPALLVEHMGAADVTAHHVPPQAMLLNASNSTQHYPDRYHELCEELAQTSPGTLHLVAAGLLAEIYCEVIRQAGGVAVDIGTAADVWMGVKSRYHLAPSIRQYQLG